MPIFQLNVLCLLKCTCTIVSSVYRFSAIAHLTTCGGRNNKCDKSVILALLVNRCRVMCESGAGNVLTITDDRVNINFHRPWVLKPRDTTDSRMACIFIARLEVLWILIEPWTPRYWAPGTPESQNCRLCLGCIKCMSSDNRL